MQCNKNNKTEKQLKTGTKKTQYSKSLKSNTNQNHDIVKVFHQALLVL